MLQALLQPGTPGARNAAYKVLRVRITAPGEFYIGRYQDSSANTNSEKQQRKQFKKAKLKKVPQKHPERKLASELRLMLQVLLEFVTPGAHSVDYI